MPTNPCRSLTNRPQAPDSDNEPVKSSVMSQYPDRKTKRPVNVSNRHLELLREPDDAPGLVGRLDSCRHRIRSAVLYERANHEGKWAADPRMPWPCGQSFKLERLFLIACDYSDDASQFTYDEITSKF